MDAASSVEEGSDDTLAGVTLWQVVAPLAAKGIGTTLGETPEPTATEVLSLALQHAIKQFTATTAASSGQEEHKTSALMGYMGAYLGMYNLLSALSDGPQVGLRWNAQSKKRESQTGGDFGIAIPVANEKYRLAFFQAKEFGRAGGLPCIDIDRPSGGYTKARDKEAEKKTAGEKRRKADEAVLAWCESELKQDTPGETQARQSKGQAAADAAVKASGGNKETAAEKEEDISHQLMKLARLHRKHGDKRWIYYACWGVTPGQPPAAVSLQTLHGWLRDRVKKHKASHPGKDYWEEEKEWRLFGPSGMTVALSRVPLSDSGDGKGCRYTSLFDILLSGVKAEQSGDWLELGIDEAADLVGEFLDMGVEWCIADDERGGGLAQRLKQVYDSQMAPGDTSPLSSIDLAAPVEGLGQHLLKQVSVDNITLKSTPEGLSKKAKPKAHG